MNRGGQFASHLGIRFNRQPSPQRLRRTRIIEAPHSPSACAAHQRLIIVEPSDERRQRMLAALIAQHDGGVSQQSAPLGTPQWSVTESRAKFRLRKIENRNQIKRVRPAARLKVLERAVWRTVVPRANVLANVTAENPVAQSFAQLGRDGRSQLNRQIANAAAAV
jgi:hypothetical protein